ncbi:sensor domain-containing protein [Clostridium sp. Marseille-QA1073]
MIDKAKNYYDYFFSEEYHSLSIEQKRCNLALNAFDGAIWEWNLNTDEFYLSSKGDQLLGVENSSQSINSINSLSKFVHPEDLYPLFIFFLERIKISNDKEFSHEYRIIQKGGNIKWVRASGKIYRSKKENINLASGFIIEITEQKKQELALAKNQMKNRLTIAGSLDSICEVDLKKKIMSFSSSINNILKDGKANEKIRYYKHWMKYIYDEDKENYCKGIKEFLNSNEVYYANQYRILNANNEIVWLETRSKATFDELGNKDYLYVSIKDITKEKLEKSKYGRLQYNDDLTGLPNRFFLREALIKKEIDSSLKMKEKIALISVDIDGFKHINDAFGHNYGDELLRQVAERLKLMVGEDDILCRFSGDEFSFLIEHIKGYIDLENRAKQIIKLFNSPVKMLDSEVFISVSIGMALYPDHGEILSDLVYKADMAMYKAKSLGKNQYYLFEFNDLEKVNRIFSIEKDLSEALNKNEMYLVFQPKISANNEEMVGLEALIRWKHLEKGFISPVEFIPIAEYTKTIIPIGRFVFDEACKKCRELLEMGYDNFKISVNLSKVQLEDKNLTNNFINILKKYNLDPRYIELEITESVIIDVLEKNLDVLDKLHKYGMSISLDDFGTGLSPLKYLKLLNLDCLKIDKSFIDDIGINKKSEHIIDGLIKLAHSLKLSVIAEGVETEEQIKYLKANNCDIIQGYYYAKPMIFEETVKFLKNK